MAFSFDALGIRAGSVINKTINESINKVAQESDVKCINNVSQAFNARATKNSRVRVCGDIDVEQQLIANFNCIQQSLLDANFRDKLATTIVTDVVAATKGTGALASVRGLTLDLAVKQEDVINRVSKALEQISTQTCTQDISQVGSLVVDDSSSFSVGLDEQTLLQIAKNCGNDKLPQEIQQRNCELLNEDCGSLRIFQSVTANGQCQQAQEIKAALETMFTTDSKTTVAATSGSDIGAIIGWVVLGLVLLALVAGLIAWLVKRNKDKQKEEERKIRHQQRPYEQSFNQAPSRFRRQSMAPIEEDVQFRRMARSGGVQPFSDHSADRSIDNSFHEDEDSFYRPPINIGTSFESKESALSQ